jgi:hypothetical protein
VRLEEIAVEKRGPVLKAYLQRAPGARPHVAVDKATHEHPTGVAVATIDSVVTLYFPDGKSELVPVYLPATRGWTRRIGEAAGSWRARAEPTRAILWLSTA